MQYIPAVQTSIGNALTCRQVAVFSPRRARIKRARCAHCVCRWKLCCCPALVCTAASRRHVCVVLLSLVRSRVSRSDCWRRMGPPMTDSLLRILYSRGVFDFRRCAVRDECDVRATRYRYESMWSGMLSRYFDFIHRSVCVSPHKIEHSTDYAPYLETSAQQE